MPHLFLHSFHRSCKNSKRVNLSVSIWHWIHLTWNDAQGFYNKNKRLDSQIHTTMQYRFRPLDVRSVTYEGLQVNQEQKKNNLWLTRHLYPVFRDEKQKSQNKKIGERLYLLFHYSLTQNQNKKTALKDPVSLPREGRVPGEHTHIRPHTPRNNGLLWGRH